MEGKKKKKEEEEEELLLVVVEVAPDKLDELVPISATAFPIVFLSD